MKDRRYLIDVCLALALNALIFLALSIGNTRAGYGFECLGGGCPDWFAYASSRLLKVSDLPAYSLFFTPTLAVAISFRGETTRKLILAVFVLVLLYDVDHVRSIWSGSFDIHGDEVGLVVFLQSLGIGYLSVLASLISTAICMGLERRRTSWKAPG